MLLDRTIGRWIPPRFALFTLVGSLGRIVHIIVLACSVGALAKVGVAAELFARDTNWILSAVAGVLVGAVWNYAVTAFYTWNRPQGARRK
jgi:putative flippase GtrA